MKTLLILFCIVFVSQESFSQPLLQKPVTIRLQNQSLGRALEIIGETGGFSFSYSSGVINPNKIVSVNADKRPLIYVLNELLGKEYKYEQIGNHLVIKKANIQKPAVVAEKRKYNYIISGYLRDEESGEGLYQVSIYEKTGLSSAISSDFGAYTLQFTLVNTRTSVTFQREGYADTSVDIIWSDKPIELNLNLISTSEKEKPNDTTSAVIASAADTGKAQLPDNKPKPIDLSKLKQKLRPAEKWIIGTRQQVHLLNIKDSFQRAMQLTFFPPVGTNGILSGQVTNNFSINLLAGYNGGVNGFEIGGLINLLRGNMKGFQAAGIGNIYNNMNGMQLSGIFNHGKGGANGFQAAGIYNITQSKGRGVQLAGISNINRSEYKGVQIAGINNFSGNNSSVLQIAGICNIAPKVKGLQLAGIVNMADTVKGSQIGLINIARYSTGVSIGVINIIGNGHHQLELASTDIQFAQIAFRSGSKNVYTILGSGFSGFSSNNFPAWGYFAGIGKAFGYGKRLSANIDFTAHELMYRKHAMNLSTAARFDFTFNLKIMRGLHLSAGPSLTVMGMDTRLEEWTGYYSKWQDRSVYFRSIEQHYGIMALIGWKAAIRFF